MRIAVMIIALSCFLFVSVQACTVYVGSELLGDRQSSQSASLGIWLALLFVLGAGLVMAVPLASAVFFAVAALIAFPVAASSIYEDMYIWGGFSVLLAILSLLGAGELKPKDENVPIATGPRIEPPNAAGLMPAPVAPIVWEPPPPAQLAPPTATSATPEQTILEQLNRLKALYDNGQITAEEYTYLKRPLLDAFNAN